MTHSLAEIKAALLDLRLQVNINGTWHMGTYIGQRQLGHGKWAVTLHAGPKREQFTLSNVAGMHGPQYRINP